MAASQLIEKKCQEIISKAIKRYLVGFAEEILNLRTCYNDDFCNHVENWKNCTEKTENCKYKCEKKNTTDVDIYWFYEDCTCEEIKIHEKKSSHFEATITENYNYTSSITTQTTNYVETTMKITTDQTYLTESSTTTSLLQTTEIPDSTDTDGLSDVVLVFIIFAAIICFLILAGGLFFLLKIKFPNSFPNRNNSIQSSSDRGSNTTAPQFPRESEENYIEMTNPAFDHKEPVEAV